MVKLINKAKYNLFKKIYYRIKVYKNYEGITMYEPQTKKGKLWSEWYNNNSRRIHNYPKQVYNNLEKAELVISLWKEENAKIYYIPTVTFINY